MGPLGFLTGVVLGSAATIALVLAMVAVIFALTSGTQAAIVAEYPSLLAIAGLFAILAGIAGAAFAGLQRRKRWRWYAQASMWLTLAVLGWHYWPQSNG